MENQYKIHDPLYSQFKEAAETTEDKGFARMEAVWNRVEEKLDNKKKRRAAAWWKYTGIAAVLLLFISVGTFVFRNETSPIVAPKVTPENNVTVIDTQKIQETFAPGKEKVKEEVVLQGDTGHDNFTVGDSIHFITTTKKARIWQSRSDTGEFRIKGEIETVVDATNGDATPQAAPLEEVVVKSYRTVSKAKVNVTTTTVTANNPTQMLQGRAAGIQIEPHKRKGDQLANFKNQSADKKFRDGDKQTLAYEPTTVTSKTIEGRPNASFVQTLQGQAPGLNITTGSGQPGNTNTTVVLRGVGSINGNIEPLYVIDGVPQNSDNFRKLNPNDITNVSVLKDASATSIYGNRGSNGVIIVTTKNKQPALTKRQQRRLEKANKKIEEEKLKNPQTIADPIPAKFQPIPVDTEDYESFEENKFENPATAPLSTFSIDVDNASYTNVRRFLNNGQTVPKDAVRVEEMINFFKYRYPQPKGDEPFSINTEYSDAPWNPKHKLLKIGLQGKDIPSEKLPASNFVFLIDVSGSMSDANKLPLLKQSMKLLVNQMRKQDRIAIVVYAGAAGLVLPSTSGADKNKIIAALENLNAGGSTAGGAGIELAYKTAQENFMKGGNNRVILATDGDFNVGDSSDSDMQTLIEEKRKSGVFLTCLGYGMGNYKDSKMEILADKGNGNYAYIDNMQEADRFLQKEFKGSMFAIAKDVKIQIEFNPKHVQSYRLIGYENRKLRDEDFANDAIDAGELGSGHTVTALYEIIPVGVKSDYFTASPELKYSQPKTTPTGNYNDELATIKFRHKKPDEDKSKETVQIIADKAVPLNSTSGDFKFAAAVAWFGLKLRDSKLVPDKSTEAIKNLAKQGLQNDPEGYRAEFIRLVDMVQ
jgi:Ca-activated chloride channel family protein